MVNNYVKSVVRDGAGRIISQTIATFDDRDPTEVEKAWALEPAATVSVFREIPHVALPVIGVGGGFR